MIKFIEARTGLIPALGRLRFYRGVFLSQRLNKPAPFFMDALIEFIFTPPLAVIFIKLWIAALIVALPFFLLFLLSFLLLWIIEKET